MRYWIRSCNSKFYNHKDAFNDLGSVDWKQRCKYEVGDIIFFYEGIPIQKIIYKTKVEKIDIPYEKTIDDKKYFTEKGKEKIKNKRQIYVRLKLIEKFNTNKLSYNNLHENGLNRAPQSPIKIKGKLLDYILKTISFDKLIKENEDTTKFFKEYKGKDKEAILKVRVGHGEFKKELLWEDSCCKLCKMSNKNLLIASHIKPWSKSNGNEKVDIDNGFLLCPNHDALFDKGYISFEDTGEIIVSSKLSNEDMIKLNINSSMKIKLSIGNKLYLKYHRENILKH